MRDAAGELADRFRLLRFEELCQRHFPFTRALIDAALQFLVHLRERLLCELAFGHITSDAAHECGTPHFIKRDHGVRYAPPDFSALGLTMRNSEWKVCPLLSDSSAA